MRRTDDSEKYGGLAYVAYVDRDATSISEVGRDTDPLGQIG